MFISIRNQSFHSLSCARQFQQKIHSFGIHTWDSTSVCIALSTNSCLQMAPVSGQIQNIVMCLNFAINKSQSPVRLILGHINYFSVHLIVFLNLLFDLFQLQVWNKMHCLCQCKLLPCCGCLLKRTVSI